MTPTRPSTAIRIARACRVEARRAADLPARCAAIIETSADFTVVASLTAARLHGLWLPTVADDVHLATATPGRAGRAMTRTRRPQFVAHRFQLREADIVLVNGLPVTSLARTWRDLAGLLSLPDLVAVGDSALRYGATTEELADAIASTPRRAYTARARAAHALLDPRSQSRPESHLRVAISVSDLPPFDVNVAVSRIDGGWLGVPDLSLADARLALEYQGEQHGTVPRLRRDLTRFADFRREGWLVLPYGPAEVFGRPWEITAETRHAVRERAPHLLRPRRRVVS